MLKETQTIEYSNVKHLKSMLQMQYQIDLANTFSQLQIYATNAKVKSVSSFETVEEWDQFTTNSNVKLLYDGKKHQIGR